MKVCYVSTAFGRRNDASGRTVDHDRIYRELIVPAVREAGLECQRADEFAGALIHKDICKAVITADVMLAPQADRERRRHARRAHPCR